MGLTPTPAAPAQPLLSGTLPVALCHPSPSLPGSGGAGGGDGPAVPPAGVALPTGAPCPTLEPATPL